MVFLSLLIYKHSVANICVSSKIQVFFPGSAILDTDEKGYLQIINLIISREERTICAYLGKPWNYEKLNWDK